jgi:dolichol-phosphate mannosyltransferase
MSAETVLKARRPPSSLSLVLPMFNEEEVLPILRRRLTGFINGFACTVEVILVDDGSSDATLAGILAWAAEDPRIVVIALSRNFGHQAAATAGLDHASGEAVVLMDADLQDPPELIHDMIRNYELGYDVVYAQRIGREGESVFKKGTAWMFYRIMRSMVYHSLPPDTGDYRLVSSECLQALREMKETHRFLRGMVAWLGFRQTAVQFVRPARVAGETKYPLRKMIRFAWTAIVSFSPTPLRVTFAFSLVIAAIGVAAAIYTIAAILFSMPVVPGWTSLMLTLCLIGSCILISIGVVGEYVAKIYEEGKHRPVYVINRRLSTLSSPNPDATTVAPGAAALT